MNKDFTTCRIIKNPFDENEDEDEDDGITVYKYSDEIAQQYKDKLIYNYFYDDLSENDIHDAYIILFAGKTGDGKTTAINAFFNIVKGIKLDDKIRLVLIEEKGKGQHESQTDGVHLYYLKDYENHPLIIIDSQGFGDTRGIQKDIDIINAFQSVFSEIIDHINSICFIVKSSDCRIFDQTKYIYSSVTSLFSEDVSDCFIIMATHATALKKALKTPMFVKTITADKEFVAMNKNIKEGFQWWYTFDSNSIFNQPDQKLGEWSYQSLMNFYENLVKKTYARNIKN